MHYEAVIFDLGGVVLGSPLHAIARYERDHGIPTGFINRVVVESGSGGAWSRLERGELELEAFYAAFEGDCRAAGQGMSARLLMKRIAEISQPRPSMLAAVGAIRSRGLKAAALTNNWVGEGVTSGGLEPVVDSGGGGHSVFAKAFLAALDDNDGVLEGQRLFDAIKRPVVLNSNQTPQYSDIRLAGHEGGDFLFVKRR